MTRMIKAISLTALAGLALSAVFASGAQAQADGVFTAGATTEERTATVITGHQYGSGEQEDLFITDSGNTTCTDTGVTYHAEDGDGNATVITATPTFSQCIANGMNPVTIDTNGCHFSFNQPESVAETGHKTWTGTIDLMCPEGEAIEITAFAFGGTGHDGHATLACTITVLPANDLGHVTYHNRNPEEGDTPKDWLTLNITLSGIKYVEHGFACTNEDTSLTENGEFKSRLKVKADNPETEEPDDHDLWIGTGE